MTIASRKRDRENARKFFLGLSHRQREDLGDQLVLGTFSWSEWMASKPSPTFMRALDDERFQWEEDGPSSNLTRRQQTAMRTQAEVGRMFMEEEEEEDDVPEARPGPAGRRTAHSQIPAGTPIRRLPPGAAGGALPFDWPNPSMSVAANPGRKKLNRPKLVDARKMAREYPNTFELPSKKAVADLRGGDFAKVSTDGERFWVRVDKRKGSKFEGVIDDDLVATDYHGLSLGDRIAFESKHLYDAVSKEQMDRALADRLAANPLDPRNPPRRRSDQLPDLHHRLRRLKDHLKSVEDILDRGKPSASERRELIEDQAHLKRQLAAIEKHIDRIEATIELEGDLLEAHPPSLWGTRTRNLSRHRH